MSFGCRELWGFVHFADAAQVVGSSSIDRLSLFFSSLLVAVDAVASGDRVVVVVVGTLLGDAAGFDSVSPI